MPIAAWQLFDYWIPDGLDVAPGDAVRARLGNRKCVGIVVSVDAISDFGDRVQPIDALAGIARLPEDLMALADFVSAYYQAPPGLAHALLLPPTTSPAPRKSNGHALAAAEADSPIDLNAAQADALATIAASDGSFAVTMLHGVTGSGKTNVYLAAAQRVVARGAQVLILVPEINLTPQFERRVQEALPNARAVTLHSRLAAGARRANWDEAATGGAQVVLATRLGVFAPLPRLALIVVDEEHDDSFKQQDGVRYHARDLAVWRAQRRNVPIVLGSATPSLET
jgi:primosomal protein N' (replication factor Y)